MFPTYCMGRECPQVDEGEILQVTFLERRTILKYSLFLLLMGVSEGYGLPKENKRLGIRAPLYSLVSTSSPTPATGAGLEAEIKFVPNFSKEKTSTSLSLSTKNDKVQCSAHKDGILHIICATSLLSISWLLKCWSKFIITR